MAFFSAKKQNVAHIVAAAGVSTASALGFVACGQSRESRVADTTSGSDSSNLSTDMAEVDCPKTIRMKWSVNEIKPQVSLRNNDEYKKALEGIANIKQASHDLQFSRVSLTTKQCVYNEKNNALAAKVFIKKVIEEQFGDDSPRFAVITRMTVRVEDGDTKTRFLSFFSIGTLPSGDTVADGDDNDIKDFLTPVADRVRSIGSIRYAFEFSKVQ